MTNSTPSRKDFARLERPEYMFHATPIWNAESVLVHSLDIKFGRIIPNTTPPKRYQCLADKINEAVVMC